MVLLPLLQDIEYAGDEKKSRRLNFFDYVYLASGNELLKFKVEINHMDAIDALEEYINSQKTVDHIILNEKEAKNTNIPLGFLFYLGKYRLENSLIKTENYFVPKSTELLSELTKKYNNCTVTPVDLYNFACILIEANNNQDSLTKKLVEKLFSGVDVELVEKFQINKDELNNIINSIKNIFKNKVEAEAVLHKLKWILDMTECNVHPITGLGLRDKFESAVEKEKQKQKVK